ncbi:adenosylmethionine--8-amino-7-oxononanoate transaminase [Paenibacillus sp. y28]|uniref:adenosylmethionine--8-amino-7-oxononanoate transaminase n=1 Tax=Paenibacillus sp. y28 TaxID=3129110 RepID=UPI0030179B2E
MDPKVKARLLEQDRRYVWHPFTQMKDYAERNHLLIERAEGIYLYDADGNAYYDTISSWWVNVHGHAHPRLKQAIREQVDRMDHVMFSGLTHAPGIELAAKLVEITPPGLSRVFYSDNGSTAVEVALKMSFQYWKQAGKPSKKTFIYLEHSYHGDTLGAVSVGGVEQFHALFRPLLFTAHRVPSPGAPVPLPGSFGRPANAAEAAADPAAHSLRAVRELLEASADDIAGVIVEPMLQAAGGMLLYPAEALRELRELCSQFAVHLIADEVAVGFGRTGAMFACAHAGVSPDLLCLSKGLTAGLMPLSVTLCTDDIYQAFYDDYETQKTFFHGHSFTGNPLAAAVALESLRIFEDEGLLQHVGGAARHLAAEMQRQLGSRPRITGLRSLGMVGAFELDAAPERRIGFEAYLEGLKHGLFLRPLGNTLYFWLPLCTTQEQISDIVTRTAAVLERLEL